MLAPGFELLLRSGNLTQYKFRKAFIPIPIGDSPQSLTGKDHIQPSGLLTAGMKSS